MENKQKGLTSPFSTGNAISLFILIAFSIILIFKALSLPIWQDEAYTIYTARLSPVEAWSRGIHFEEQSPLYYLIISIWEKILPSINGLRLFSVVSAVCCGFILLNLNTREKKISWENLFLFFLALPHLLWAGLEIRLYAFSMLLLLLFFYMLELWNTLSVKKLAILILIGAVNFYINFLSTIPICLMLFYYSLYKKKTSYIYIMIFSVLLFLPILLQLYNILGKPGGENMVNFLESLKYSAQTAFLILADARNVLLLRVVKWGCILFIVVFLVMRKDLSILFLILGILAFSMMVYLTGNMDVLSYRHFLCLLPLLFLFIIRFNNYKFSFFILLPLALMSVFAVSSLVSIDSKAGEWDVVADIAEKYDTGKILIFTSENIYPFEIYYEGSAEIHTVPNEINRESFDIKSIEIKNKNQLDMRFNQLIEKNEKFLFIGSLEWKEYRGVNFNTDLLSEYINERFNIIDYQNVDGTSIYYLGN